MQTPYIVGVGAANADLSGASLQPLRLRDSNPGHIRLSAGGVTRNVCENLARLGADVKLISAVGEDAFGDMILAQSRASGMDLTHVLRRAHTSSVYLSILDASGDMLVGMSDMRIIQSQLRPEDLYAERALLTGAAAVTCDPCITEQTLQALIEICRGAAPIYADPVSTAYAKRLAPYAGAFDTLKPNRMELEILAGAPVDTEQALTKAGEAVLKKGTRRLFVSLGNEGCLYMDRQGAVIRRKMRPVSRMVNATGAGDAFAAAVLYGTLRGMNELKTLDYALAAGIAALSDEATINPNMSPALLETIIKENSL